MGGTTASAPWWMCSLWQPWGHLEEAAPSSQTDTCATTAWWPSVRSETAIIVPTALPCNTALLPATHASRIIMLVLQVCLYSSFSSSCCHTAIMTCTVTHIACSFMSSTLGVKWLPFLQQVTNETLVTIFQTILSWHLDTGGFPVSCKQLGPGIISATLDMYIQSMAKLLPTPTKSHYTFNLRDFARVIQVHPPLIATTCISTCMQLN